jgi:3-hydroxy-9,10-secoandrosta-1,3,5(10)-triene-9,17-dione monooxygenase reductase component
VSSEKVFDATEFRKALGAFATGVTIITTRAADGSPLGLTVNSFNSVSLNPPLVLWSMANTAMSLPTFRAAQNWAVHVLAADQDELSGRFARRGEDKFSGLDTEMGIGSVPLLRGCTARFQCRTAFQYEGGDHVIFVGEVLSFDRSETAPLVFHSGRYAHATPRDANLKLRHAYLEGSFNEGFLGYLLGRSHFQFFGKIRPYLAQAGLNDEEFYVLSTLTLKQTITADAMAAGMAGVLGESSGTAMQSLIKRGFVSANGADYQLTPAGSECALRLISAAKAVESQLIERLGPGEAPALKSLLNHLLSLLDPNASTLWQEQDPVATDRA